MQNRILSRVFFYKRCIYGSEQAENGEKLTPVSIDKFWKQSDPLMGNRQDIWHPDDGPPPKNATRPCHA